VTSVKRKPLIAGNWKMHKTLGEARKLALDVKHSTLNHEDVEILVCPPFGALLAVGEVVGGSHVRLGAQNCHWEREGPFTGEVSPPMLKDLGCEYAIVGHSERRHLFEEPDEWIAKKAAALLSGGLMPVVCVGETLEEREAGRTRDRVRDQILGSLRGIASNTMLRVVIAYEPVWAIGTGKTATPEQAEEVHAFIRNIVIDLHGLEVALATRILYGGSVKPGNISELMAQEDIDGALVGGASLSAETFAQIVGFSRGD
jgi:triosephosphate isomerase